MNVKKYTPLFMIVILITMTVGIKAMWDTFDVAQTQKKSKISMHIGDFSSPFGNPIPKYVPGNRYAAGTIVQDDQGFYYLIKQDIDETKSYDLAWYNHKVMSIYNSNLGSFNPQNHPNEGYTVSGDIAYFYKNGSFNAQQVASYLTFSNRKYTKTQVIPKNPFDGQSVVYFENIVYIANQKYKQGHVPGIDVGWTPMNHVEYMENALYTKALQGEVVSVRYAEATYTLLTTDNYKNKGVVAPGDDDRIWKKVS